MEQAFELIRLAGLALTIGLITTLLKKASRDTEALIVSIIGTIIMLTITINYILDFFSVIETMLTF